MRLPLPAAAEPRADTPLPASKRGQDRLRGLRVLVVEDNQDSAEMLRALLEDLGAEVAVASDGESGVDCARSVEPHVVLLDIGLPGISGYDVARELRRFSWGKRTLIVALTGWGQADDRARSQAAGFDRHLVEPILP